MECQQNNNWSKSGLDAGLERKLTVSAGGVLSGKLVLNWARLWNTRKTFGAQNSVINLSGEYKMEKRGHEGKQDREICCKPVE